MAKPDPSQDPVNDRKEGMLRDPVVWKQGKTAENPMDDADGEIVSYVKDIGNGDPGYDAAVRKVLIMKQDGTEVAVPEVEITRDRQKVLAPVSREPNRVPDATFPADLKGAEDGGEQQNLQERPAPGSGEDVGQPNRTTGATTHTGTAGAGGRGGRGARK